MVGHYISGPEKRIPRVLAVALAVVLAPGFALESRAGQSGSRAPTPVQTPAPGGRATAAGSAAPSVRTQGSQENTSGDTAGNAVLQTQIQDALRKEPTLTNSSVKVTALAETIELTGSVASSRERLNAGRLAQSYARGKRVVNHIVVSGHALDSADKLNANHPAILARPAGTPLSNQ